MTKREIEFIASTPTSFRPVKVIALKRKMTKKKSSNTQINHVEFISVKKAAYEVKFTDYGLLDKLAINRNEHFSMNLEFVRLYIII